MLRWEGLLGVANTVRVHGSVSVFNIDAKELTESVPVFGAGTVSADSKGNPEVKLTSSHMSWANWPDLNALWKVSTGTSPLVVHSCWSSTCKRLRQPGS